MVNRQLTLFVHTFGHSARHHRLIMVLDNIPLFAMLKGRLGHLSQRERLIAELGQAMDEAERANVAKSR